MQAERLHKAISYLKGEELISVNQDIIKRMGINKSSFSLAFNGNEKYLTESFLRKFNAAFDELFRIDWLLGGEGDMLTCNSDLESGIKSEVVLTCDEKTLSKFANAIESIAQSNSTMSDTNKILAQSNAELVDQLRKLLATYEKPREVSYSQPEQKPLQASDKKFIFKP